MRPFNLLFSIPRGVLALLFILNFLSVTYSQEIFDSTAKSLSELSFEELLNLEVTGAAVKDLGFSKLSQTENSTPIFDQPYSIEITSAKTIEARNLKNTIEATENTTGVISGTSPGSPFGFSMRGFSGDFIKILYDGVHYGISTLNTRPYGTSSIDHLEVLKGPTTLLNGRSGTGGTINIISKKPKLVSSPESEVYLSYGSFNSTLLNIGVNGPLTKSIAYRVDFDKNTSEGWVDNSNSELLNFNGAILFKPNKRFSSLASVNIAHDHVPGYWGTPLVPEEVANEPLDVLSTNDGSVIDGDIRFNNYNVTDHEISANSNRINWNSTLLVSDHLDFKLKTYLFTTERIWKNSENYVYDQNIDGFVRDRFQVEHQKSIYGVHAQIHTNKSIFNLKNDFTARLEFNQDNFDRTVGFMNGIEDTVSLYHPVGGNFGSVDGQDDYFYETLNALVIEDVLTITKTLTLFLGTRLEYQKVKRERFNFDGSTRVNQTLDTNYFLDNYKLGLVFKPHENVRIYTNYANQHGAVAGDISTTSLANANTFTPSTISQIEVGTKNKLFRKKLQLALALFHIKRSIDIETPGNQFSVNEQLSTGAEVSLKGSLTEHFTLGGSYAYTYARFGKNYDADYDRIVTNNTPINAPKHVSDFWLSYGEILDIPVELGLGCKLVSERMANTANDVVLSPYQVFNAFIAYNFESFRTAFHIRNFTNEDYIPWADVYYTSQYLLASPRTFELTFSADF